MGTELDKVEIIKQSSDSLRGQIKEVLTSDSEGFEESEKQLLKFHGLYQQKLRGKDIPDEQKIFSFMIRGRIPGGRLTSEQYKAWDELGEKYGGKALRLTTRQSVQLHGILKGNLKSVMQKLKEIQLSSMGACGDVVRNVTQAVNPWADPKLSQLDPIADLLSDHFKYTSNAYSEIWLDGEKVEEKEDPIYGKSYLPRKFKIAVTLVGNNSVDLYTNDMGFAATLDDAQKIDGYFVFAGGGLGMTHKKPATFPRKADLLGWIPANELIPVADAIVTSHRDYGDRTNRKHARLKYVIADRGLEWFRDEVEKRANTKFSDKGLPEWKTPSYLGWQSSANGKLSLGVHILSGRVKDTEEKPLKSALLEIIDTYKLDVQVTADQDLVLLNVPIDAKEKIEARFKELNIDPFSPSPLHDRALACPALPTCALALTESERSLPDILDVFQGILKKHALSEKAPVIRMTGCPNGCARPYSAEIGIVGQQSGGKYAIYIGGDSEGTRIGTRVIEKATVGTISDTFDKLFNLWKENSHNSTFGDFINNAGAEKVMAQIQ
ncbi:MAG: NADPH-dependent assimilatory sulfite reductase hemoprotein subunit [Spirochaetota bacterium]